MKYKIVEGIAKADVAFEAYGKTEEELFENAALALFEIMVDTATVEPLQNSEFRIQNSELADLLFDFLEELVFLKDAKNMLFSKFKVSVGPPSEESPTLRRGHHRRRDYPKPYTLVAKIWGEEINPPKHKPHLDVKAVTRHKFFVKKERGRYIAQVVLDI